MFRVGMSELHTGFIDFNGWFITLITCIVSLQVSHMHSSLVVKDR